MRWYCARGGVPAALGLVLALSWAPRAAPAPRLGPWERPEGNASYVGVPVLISEHPHEPGAFTQGLCFDGAGRLLPLSCPIDLADAVSQLPRARLRDLHTAFGDSRVALT